MGGASVIFYKRNPRSELGALFHLFGGLFTWVARWLNRD